MEGKSVRYLLRAVAAAIRHPQRQTAEATVPKVGTTEFFSFLKNFVHRLDRVHELFLRDSL